MLVKLEVIPCNDNIIILPPQLSTELRKQVLIIFGTKKMSAQVDVDENNNLSSQSASSDTPIQITISSSLKDQLLIQEELPYQIKIYNSKIVIGPVIGLMLGNNKNYYNIKFLNRNRDRLKEYKQRGGLICAFSSTDINWRNKSVYGYYYNGDESTWKKGEFPIPDVIYRRHFHVKRKFINRLKKLTKGRVFNSYRFTKYQLYKYFKKHAELVKNLPPTELCKDIEQVKDFIKSHNSVILKPINLSRGRGICIIKKTSYGYRIFDYRKNKVKKQKLRDEQLLIDFVTANEFFNGAYIIQKYISLAKIKGYPYDVRVVMQKVKKNKWKYMGEECRVSRKSLITNISRGGYALFLKEAIVKSFKEEDYEEIKDKITEICNKICYYMDEWGQHYAEFGIDIGIDEEKNIWIIEVNVLPSYKGFKSLDRNLFLTLRSNPLLYAISLTEFEDSLD